MSSGKRGSCHGTPLGTNPSARLMRATWLKHDAASTRSRGPDESVSRLVAGKEGWYGHRVSPATRRRSTFNNDGDGFGHHDRHGAPHGAAGFRCSDIPTDGSVHLWPQ